MRALHASSLSLKTDTTPVLVHAAMTYSESQDHAAWVIQWEVSSACARPFCLLELASAAAVGEGVGSTSQVRAIWNESDRRMMRRSWTAVRRKCVPGLKETRDEVCL